MRVKLFRDSFDTPWGFRLQGGRDLNQPLVVQRVFSNTPAEGELQRGDIFLEINGRDAEGFTHKQALDQIKFGGGQIELLIERPATPNINPLHPQSPTRAPSNLPPVLPGAIQIPIKKRPEPVYAAPSMPPPQNTSGHQPKKITLNQFGGGTANFGASYGKPSAKSGWSPQPSPSSQQQYSPQSSMMVRVQDSLDSALSPKSFSSYQSPAQHQAPPPMRQFSAGPSYPSQGLSSAQAELQDQQPSYIRSCDPVPEEDYTYIPVSQRKQTFNAKPPPPQQDIRYNNGNNEFEEVAEEEEDNYPTAPVWERRKMFGQAVPTKKATPGGKKGPKPFKPQSKDYIDFGVDYTKIQKQPEPPRFQPAAAPPPPPPPVQPRPVNYSGHTTDDGYDKPPAWSSSLRSSNVIKPWELEQQENFMPAQNTPQRGGPPSVSPKPTSPRPPAQAPVQRQISVRSVPNGAPLGGDGGDARVVHLQYNSPMGLYSGANIKDTYTGQTQGRYPMSSTATSSGPAKTGDRDWSESHVYRMLHDQSGPPASHAAPTVNTKPPPPPVSYKPVPPPPAPPAQKQYQQSPQNNFNAFDDSYGTSDF